MRKVSAHYKDWKQSCQGEDRAVEKDNNRDNLVSKVFLERKRVCM